VTIYRAHRTVVFAIAQLSCLKTHLEVCMGMGFPVGMGFPWDSRENGNEKHISMGMGMGMGMISVGVGMTKKYMVQKFPICCHI